MKKIWMAIVGFAVITTSTLTFAESGKADVLLRIKGNITKFNSKDGKSYEFTEKDLMTMKNYEVTATTPFAPKSVFKGPRLSDILKKAGANPAATMVIAKSIDGYQVKLPLSDFKAYEPVASLYRAGQRLTLETKGPIWLMYPVDKFPEQLTGPLTESKVVWSLKEFEVLP